jgi:indole-3-glycerol phosphate synthase
MSKLDEILAWKQHEVQAMLHRQEALRGGALRRNDFRSLVAALRRDSERLGLIAEVKKASPSAGTIRADIVPMNQALAYEKAGASAISVLTDEKFFAGHLSDMTKVRQSVQIPVLRKDFMVHEVQIYEAVVAGADAILLIVAALAQSELVRLMDIAQTFQLEVLVEVHDLPEMDRALEAGATLIGINNRNLKTFKVDLVATEELAEQVDEDVVLVSESGIKSAADAQRAALAGADALLVGETLMRASDLAGTIAELRVPRL